MEKSGKIDIRKFFKLSGITDDLKNCSLKKEMEDTFTQVVLKKHYNNYKTHVLNTLEVIRETGVKVRINSFPEYISENIIKFIIHNYLQDTTSTWKHPVKKGGDLYSEKEGIQECKCFTSEGPCSFSPSSEWNALYFLDARNWLDDKFVLYRTALKKSSNEWKNIKINKTQTFQQQVRQGRRPHICWEVLYPQISNHTVKVFEGSFLDIFKTVSTTTKEE
jgi:hypothetical protein